MAKTADSNLTFRVNYANIQFNMNSNNLSPEAENTADISASNALLAVGALGEIGSLASSLTGLALVLRAPAEATASRLFLSSPTSDCLVGVGFLGGAVSLAIMITGFYLRRSRAS